MLERRATRQLHWTAAVTAVSALVLSAAACSAPTRAAPTSEDDAVADPAPILDGFAATMREHVTDLTTGVPTRESVVSSDTDQSCADTADWPRQWDYTVHLSVDGTSDARPQAQAIVDRLDADGWHLRDIANGDPARVNVVAQRDGFGVTVTGEATVGGMVVIATSPCVDQDGTIDRSEVA